MKASSSTGLVSEKNRMRGARIYYFLGLGCLAATFVFVVLAVYGAAAGIKDAPLAGSVCAVAFFIPGIVFLLYRTQATALDARLKALADVLKGYREVTMNELANKIGVKEEDAELLVAACIGRGLVKGRLVAGEGRFVLNENGQQTTQDDAG